MLSQYLQSITGIQDLGIISLVIAPILFAVVLGRALRLDRRTQAAMAALPLDVENGRTP